MATVTRILKGKRKILRSIVTKTINDIDGEENAVDAGKLNTLKVKAAELNAIDNELLDAALEGEDEDETLAEALQAVKYQEKAFACIAKAKANEGSESGSRSVISESSRGSIKLPKLELRTFAGELSEWLGWWAHFEKIDSAPLDKAEKFQYLVQALRGPAKDLVMGFPPTGENYDKALKTLKERYGNKDILGELYTRELLALCLAQAKSHEERNIQIIHDKIETSLRALESLDINMDGCAPILAPLVESTLPEDVLKAFRRALPVEKQASKDRLKFLLEFLKKEIDTELRVKMAAHCFDDPSIRPTQREFQRYTAEALHTGVGVCVFCGITGHAGKDCRKAMKMRTEEKKNTLLKKGRCFRCTEAHLAKDCDMAGSCSECGRKHLLVMCPVHRFGRASKQEDRVGDQQRASEKAEAQETQVNSVETVGKTILPTILVPLKGKWGQRRKVRALVDTGSQKSYILSTVAEKLQMPIISRERISFVLFGGVKTEEKELNCYSLRIETNDFEMEMEVLGTESISDYSEPMNVQELTGFGPGINIGTGPVQMLIGADNIGAILTGNRQAVGKLTALETVFGWTLLGQTRKGKATRTRVNLVMSTQDEVTNFWSLELLGIKDGAPQEQMEEEIRDRFLDSVQQGEDGMYTVSLPWNGDVRPPSNRKMALSRLQSVTCRMSPELYKAYDEVLKEWQRTGILEKAEDNGEGHYLAHRAVVRNSSSTTRVRPVFDASAKSKPFPSLNDSLSECANIIELLPSILLRFRQNRLGVCADIEKAFLRIQVCQEDREFLKMLWWNEEGEIIALRHCRVVFGLKPSPFLLCSVLKAHLKKLREAKFQPSWVIEKMEEAYYMDDLVSSVGSNEELCEFKASATKAMESASMCLRKWKNTGGEPEEVKVLGVLWSTDADELGINLDWWEENALNCPETKRQLLSLVQKIFDPIGMASPFTIVPKMLLQKLWSKNLGWDTPVPEEDKVKMLQWWKEIGQLKNLRIKRGFDCGGDKRSIHIFCDASKSAYAATLFLLVEGEKGWSTRFITGKSRVAPNGMTIPRLELMAVLIGARLLDSVKTALHWETTPTVLWSDSTTAITWIQRQENWSTFVKNRVEEVRKRLGSASIRHVPGHLNPADLPSRGATVQKLLDLRWWEGPSWLRNPEEWPADMEKIDESEIRTELKKSAIVLTLVQEEPCFLLKYSSFGKMLRLVAWMKRFARRCRGESSCPASLTVREIEEAELTIFKIVQQNEKVKPSLVKELETYEDEKGVMRIRTRLTLLSDALEGFKRPVLLPGKNEIVLQYIRWRHEKTGHSGIQALLNDLREKVWIIGGRKAVRKVVHSCVTCKRFMGKHFERPTPPLPEDRIRDAAAFEICGVDFCGPFLLSTSEKAWVCLFTCAVYRAVHLELCLSLSTNCFIQALRCFVARRGRPKRIYSDCGTNFVGAANLLEKVSWDEVNLYATSERMEWVQNVPSAPWWGGWWERLVGMLKQILRRVLGHACLSYQELYAVLCDCESRMNNRPLTYCEENSEIVPMTPAMFLRDLREDGVPDEFHKMEKIDLQRRRQYVERLRMDLRKRFKAEYLGFLRAPRSKSDYGTLAVGDVVLVGDDSVKPINFPLGVVERLIEGRDGIVRSVELRTEKGRMLRPVQRLYPLEISSRDVPPEKSTDIDEADGQLPEIPPDDFPKTAELPQEECPEIAAEEEVVSDRRGRIIRRPVRFQ